MAVSRVTREDLVEQSISDFLREQMFTVRQYPAARVELLDAFVESRIPSPLTKNFLALGFNFDDGGEQAELGSDLIRRQYVIEVWVIGLSAAEGRNLANATRDSLETDGLLPLRDVTQPAKPIIDWLQIDPITVARQPVPNPKPWQEFLWTVTIRVWDEYNARLV